MWDDFRPIDAHRRFLGICLADEERLIAKQKTGWGFRYHG